MHICLDLNFYHREALNAHASIVTGESTPSYMLHSDIVLPRLKSTLPANSFKLLVMLRNPTSRAYSHYNMSIDMTGTPEQNKNRYVCNFILCPCQVYLKNTNLYVAYTLKLCVIFEEDLRLTSIPVLKILWIGKSPH